MTIVTWLRNVVLIRRGTRALDAPGQGTAHHGLVTPSDPSQSRPLLSAHSLLSAAVNVASILFVAAWTTFVVAFLQTRGLFNWLGTDWAMYWGATRLFVIGGPAAAYDVRRLPEAMRPLLAFYGPLVHGQVVGPTPYPPIFFTLFIPFTWVPPRLGFLSWTLINFGLGLYVFACVARKSGFQSWGLPVSLALSFPFAYGVFVGQPVGIMLFCFWRFLSALERGDDFVAGLWLGWLVYKPQLLPVFGLVFLLKRRWRALGGLSAVAGTVALGSTLWFGVGWITSLLQLLVTDYAGVDQVQSTVSPQHMISWRGVVVNLAPGVGNAAALIIIAMLSIIALAVLPAIWRGDWSPVAPEFPDRVVGTLIVTFLVGYHSHIHEATLLLVPAVAVVARRGTPRPVKWMMVASVYGFPLLFFATLMVPYISMVFVIEMLIVLVLVTLEGVSHSRVSKNEVTSLTAVVS